MKTIKIYENVEGRGKNWFSFTCKVLFDFSIDNDNNIEIKQVYTSPGDGSIKWKEEELKETARGWLKGVDNTKDDYKRQIANLQDEVDDLNNQITELNESNN